MFSFVEVCGEASLKVNIPSSVSEEDCWLIFPPKMTEDELQACFNWPETHKREQQSSKANIFCVSKETALLLHKAGALNFWRKCLLPDCSATEDVDEIY